LILNVPNAPQDYKRNDLTELPQLIFWTLQGRGQKEKGRSVSGRSQDMVNTQALLLMIKIKNGLVRGFWERGESGKSLIHP
jgi:hypothetical protein